MAEYSLDEFVKKMAQDESEADLFELESPYMLELNLDGRVWAKVGSMIAYTGAVDFVREKALERGVGKMLRRMATGEGQSMMKVEGKGRVYVADQGKKVQILKLADDTIFVNGNDLLAMEDGLDWDVTMMRRVAGMMAGGLFNIRVSGTGMVAITSHYDPLVLRVTAGQPVFTDPNATVAWSGSLSPDFVSNITMRTLIGRGSGETFQMKFEGEGWVVIQPYEEVYAQAVS